MADDEFEKRFDDIVKIEKNVPQTECCNIVGILFYLKIYVSVLHSHLFRS
jgi:hypothetical protein